MVTDHSVSFVFRNGQHRFDYGGKYTKEGIVEWLEKYFVLYFLIIALIFMSYTWSDCY